MRLCELQEYDRSVNMDGKCLKSCGVLITLEFNATFWNFVGQATFFCEAVSVCSSVPLDLFSFFLSLCNVSLALYL